MSTSRLYSRTSAQQADPLSWFTGPYIPLVFAGLIFVVGTTVTLLSWNDSPTPWLRLLGLWLCSGGCLVVHVCTRPLKPSIGCGVGVVALSMSLIGLTLATLDYADVNFHFGTWWIPAAPTAVLVTLAPYLSPWKIFLLGATLTVLITAVSLAILYPINSYQGPIATAIVFAYEPAVAAASATVFSYSVVSTVLSVREEPSSAPAAEGAAPDEVAAEMRQIMIARFTARAVPFLEGIAAAGRVTPVDRARAGQLAQHLREDLVTQASESWLDTIAASARLVVIDPDHRASQMSVLQRTATLAMLRALLDFDEGEGSLTIRLRADDEATVVTITEIHLPEKQRMVSLAPYYLTLRSAVDELVLDRNRVTFRVVPER